MKVKRFDALCILLVRTSGKVPQARRRQPGGVSKRDTAASESRLSQRQHCCVGHGPKAQPVIARGSAGSAPGYCRAPRCGWLPRRPPCVATCIVWLSIPAIRLVNLADLHSNCRFPVTWRMLLDGEGTRLGLADFVCRSGVGSCAGGDQPQRRCSVSR